MVSAAEQMAANTSWAALGKATDLRNRILFTIGLLIVYRLGTWIPVPGIDTVALRQFMDSAGQGIGGPDQSRRAASWNSSHAASPANGEVARPVSRPGSFVRSLRH